MHTQIERQRDIERKTRTYTRMHKLVRQATRPDKGYHDRIYIMSCSRPLRQLGRSATPYTSDAANPWDKDAVIAFVVLLDKTVSPPGGCIHLTTVSQPTDICLFHHSRTNFSFTLEGIALLQDIPASGLFNMADNSSQVPQCGSEYVMTITIPSLLMPSIPNAPRAQSRFCSNRHHVLRCAAPRRVSPRSRATSVQRSHT